jgi:hypothetical protein
MKPKHPAGPPMTLGNIRQLGVQNLVASCLNDALSARRADRRVELSGRHRGAVVVVFADEARSPTSDERAPARREFFVPRRTS